jgi:3-phenylpropionate/trans-cinnamate dioxygenase ferredoxin component
MGTFFKAGNTSEFADGTKKKVTVNGQEVLLARVGAGYYAIDNKCPHMGGDLSAGKLDGTVITCLRHGSQFDLKDGRNIRWTNWPGPVKTMADIIKSPRPVNTYKVKTENGEISIEV